MKTQKEMLKELLSEINDIKMMISRVHGYVVEIQDSELKRKQNEVDKLSTPATLTVNEDRDCLEYDQTSIHLDRQERMLINSGVNFCIRGEDLSEDDDEYTNLMIWEFNSSKKAQVIVYAVMLEAEGKEDEYFRDCVYEGKIHQYMLREDE